jgi:hypothetical protein
MKICEDIEVAEKPVKMSMKWLWNHEDNNEMK